MKSLEGLSFYIRDGHEVFYNEKAVRDVGTHLTTSNSTGRTFPTIDFVTDFVGKAAGSSAGFELMAQAREPARSILEPIIIKLRAHVIDDFRIFGRGQADLAKLMDDFHAAMVTQQSLALADNLLHVDRSLPTNTTMSLAAAQNVSSGGGQEAPDSDPLPTRTPTQAHGDSTDSTRNKRCKITYTHCIGADIGEIDTSTDVKCPCGVLIPSGFRSSYCSTICHKRYVTDNPSSTVLDEMIRRFQITMDYQYELACAAADHAHANDGTKFIPPAPPQL